jgi:hypothetical protein
VGRLLRVAGFSLQANAKTLEGAQHPDRDAQFRYINEQVKDHQAGGEPVISVDTKKREQLGRLPMAGREWRPKGRPVEVEDHSFFFTGPEVEQAIPYGIYDITRDSGWVNVGTDHDTSVFAVESIRRWWRARGRDDYPGASRLLITADAGGSNSYRYRVWKSELAALAAETGLVITVCHFPPGTSKWNKYAWPGGHPGGMKCSRRLAGRGRRLDTGALRVRNKSGAGPAGPGIVAACTNPRFG